MTLLLLAFATTSRCAIAQDTDDARPTTNPTEIRRGVTMGGTSEERGRQFYENVIRKVEPSLKGDPARLPVYIELFKREFVEDPRTFAIDLRATRVENGGVAVTGHVEFEEHRRSLTELLKHLGFSADLSGVSLYPLAELGEQQFAVVRADRAFLYDKPAAPRETLTEALNGDGLFLLAPADNGYFLCHAADGYVGYISGDVLERATGAAFDEGVNPLGAAVDERVEGAIAAASKLMGTKYVWGGMTSEGIDCSGLVHTAFRSQGVRLPRDADQQALVGKLVATRWHRSSLRRGDLLFFLGRRGTISHTAIYLGNDEFLEATSPVVTVSSFDPSAPHYSKRRDDGFCFAKRVFD
ncbi:MAG TPA: C40 family peptidase [Tepidisphaeraceae bacterium]|nr:C40 family peptidase [Tepidisphaeraceae bacterium]